MARVNGESLANLLTSLNCNFNRTLEGSSLDWLFEHPKLKEFLYNFCKAAEFKKIVNVKKQEGIKASSLLTTAYDSKSQIRVSEFQKRIREKTKEIAMKEMLKLELKNQREVLRREISMIKKEKINCELAKLKVERDCYLEKENCQLLRKELSEVLDDIVVNLREFINTVECESNIRQANGISCSFSNLEPYLNMEEMYLNALQGYVNKQFKNEIWGMDVSGSFSGKSLDSGVSLNQSTSGLINFFKWKKELSRLKDCLLSSKEKIIRAQVLKESLKEQITLIEETILKNVPEQGLDVWQLKFKIERGSSNLDEIKSQLSILSKETMPKEITKIVNSILKDVITANYTIKIKRQQYFVDKQIRLFQLLLEQQSRLSLLHIAVQIKDRQTCQFEHLIETIIRECAKKAELSQKSIDYMKGLKSNEENEAKYLLTAANLASNIIADIIGKNKEELFVSYQSLSNSAQNLKQKFKDLKKIIGKNSSDLELLTSQIAFITQSLDDMNSPLVADCIGSVELKQQFGLLESEMKKMEANSSNIFTIFDEKLTFLENCEREKLKRKELRKKFELSLPI